MTDIEDLKLRQIIHDLEQKYGEVFGLRAFPGDRFKISKGASYVTFYDGVLRFMIYVYRLDDDKWEAFSKGTPTECRRNFVRLEAAP